MKIGHLRKDGFDLRVFQRRVPRKETCDVESAQDGESSVRSADLSVTHNSAQAGSYYSRSVSATIGKEAETLVGIYGRRTSGATHDAIVAASRKMGFKGEVVVLEGSGGGAVGAAAIGNELVVFENAYLKGFDAGNGRFLQGDAMLAHEIGHTLAPISHNLDLGKRSSQFWLREVQASVEGATLPGLSFDEYSMLLDDIIVSIHRWSRASGRLKHP